MPPIEHDSATCKEPKQKSGKLPQDKTYQMNNKLTNYKFIIIINVVGVLYNVHIVIIYNKSMQFTDTFPINQLKKKK